MGAPLLLRKIFVRGVQLWQYHNDLSLHYRVVQKYLLSCNDRKGENVVPCGTAHFVSEHMEDTYFRRTDRLTQSAGHVPCDVDRVQHLTIVELGAGCGLVGIHAATCGARVCTFHCDNLLYWFVPENLSPACTTSS